jgi:hypothetical protein
MPRVGDGRLSSGGPLGRGLHDGHASVLGRSLALPVGGRPECRASAMVDCLLAARWNVVCMMVTHRCSDGASHSRLGEAGMPRVGDGRLSSGGPLGRGLHDGHAAVLGRSLALPVGGRPECRALASDDRLLAAHWDVVCMMVTQRCSDGASHSRLGAGRNSRLLLWPAPYSFPGSPPSLGGLCQALPPG